MTDANSINQEFDQFNERIVYQSNPPWVTVKQTKLGFFFLERKGKDSVAVFLLRQAKDTSVEKKYEVLIRLQPLPVDNTDNQALFVCPITGSIDNHEATRMAAKREAMEEAGYDLSLAQLSHFGSYIVGTQTNEVVYLYCADVSNLQPSNPQGDGTYFESVSENEWIPFKALADFDYAACQIGYLKLSRLDFK
jgi:8-oxo-dGTP pyrophosphatase MutT (NUDIX family)